MTGVDRALALRTGQCKSAPIAARDTLVPRYAGGACVAWQICSGGPALTQDARSRDRRAQPPGAPGWPLIARGAALDHVYDPYRSSNSPAWRSLTTERLTLSVGVSSPASIDRSRSRMTNFLICSTWA